MHELALFRLAGADPWGQVCAINEVKNAENKRLPGGSGLSRQRPMGVSRV